MVTIDGEDLTYCDIQIVCVDEEVFKCVMSSVKVDSSTFTEVDALAYTISVAVPTPSLFKQYLTFKYLETLGLLQEECVKPQSKLAKIARVRATVVTERMRSEFGYDLTIDLNVNKKVRGDV